MMLYIQSSSTFRPTIWSINMGDLCTCVGDTRGIICGVFHRYSSEISPKVIRGKVVIFTISGCLKSCKSPEILHIN